MSKLYITILLFASTLIFAQQQYKGSLQYANKTPVSLADVIILKDDQIIDEISTDDKGSFTVDLAEGNYTFRIEDYKMDTIEKKLTFDFDWVNFNNEVV
ncbi:hypothetical protein [Empedobacter falsenii]|uniref:hypothetical protein n=1 Tax=Empedobacter falsenii TaxID=343874 RepID=UPI000570D015|nr:hypothetical protein [Empedobacter falsenii]